MAEHRPYRITNAGAQAHLTQVKFVAVSGFLMLALLINWETTQRAARLFGYSPLLGPPLWGGIYAPWDWIVWWSRWHDTKRLEPLWELCTREVTLPLLGFGGLAAGAI